MCLRAFVAKQINYSDMKKTIKLFLAFIAVLAFTSCEDVIQVKLDKGEPIVTIDAFINDMRSQQKVRLTYTDGYFSQKTNAPIVGATVVLKDLTNGQVYNFTDNTDGNYVFNLTSTDTLGRVGNEYEITVTHQGNVYTSSTALNRTAQIDSLHVEYREPGGFGGDEGYIFSFHGQDPTGDIPDFYWVKSYRNGVFFNKGSEINVAWDGANGTGADGLYFIPPISQAVTPSGEVFQKFDVCRVEIHSINRDTYDFFLQVQRQTTNYGLFATTPENVKTNLKCTTSDKIKVVGWFSMSAVGSMEKVAQ